MLTLAREEPNTEPVGKEKQCCVKEKNINALQAHIDTAVAIYQHGHLWDPSLLTPM